MTNKPSVETETYWFILGGINSDVSQLDFSRLNVHCFPIGSDELKREINNYEYSERNLELISKLEEANPIDRLFVFTPIDYSKEQNRDLSTKILDILILLFPSDLSIRFEITLQCFDYKSLYWGSYHDFPFNSSGEKSYDENFLSFDVANINSINQFINLFIDRFQNIKYINPALDYYVSSFFQRAPSISYIGFCISLEAITSADVELSYRIKRNVAILVGRSAEDSGLIYKNINKLYSLRSKIVHSGKYSAEKIAEYLPYLKLLVSRMIIEIVLHNIPEIVDLNNRFTALGFGQYELISEKYDNLSLNSRTISTVTSTILS